MKLIDLNNDKIFEEVKISENELSFIILKNWKKVFGNLSLIGREFSLKGDVRNQNKGGRLDFFAFNNDTKSFVIIEIKNEYDKNIRSQILDYTDFIEENYEYVYLKAKEKLTELDSNKYRKNIELILLSKDFKPNDYRIIKKIEYSTTLITYHYFSNNYLLLNTSDNSNKVVLSTDISTITIDNSNQLFVDEFWNNFKTLSLRGIIQMNIDYKIEGFNLIVRIDKVYEKYISLERGQSLPYVSLNLIRKYLTKSDAYILKINSSRFGNQITSGYVFDLLKIKSKYGI